MVEHPNARNGHMRRHGQRSGITGDGKPLSSMRERRVAWLLKHPDVWRDLPSDKQDVDNDLQRSGLIVLGECLVIAGLYSKSTDLKDRNWGIRVLIGEARRRLA